MAAQGLAAQGFAPHSFAAQGFAEQSLAAHGPAAQGFAPHSFAAQDAAVQSAATLPSSASSAVAAALSCSTGSLPEQADVAMARPPATANIDANFILFICFAPNNVRAEKPVAAAPLRRIRNVRPWGRANGPVVAGLLLALARLDISERRNAIAAAYPMSAQVRGRTAPGYSKRDFFWRCG
ncbi:hypothetical protein [Sphingopyxis sp. LC81]|uniref:hypothetical protein n=1 Tax=Sphingopyxis sp. LC81 TaxID=1502850 RepID=UPI0013780DE8|nr:hypothetical protein [Sphingopyxis sp. LC81]